MDNTNGNNTLKIAFGDTALEFKLFSTSAPKSYDGAHTFTVYEDANKKTGKTKRFVLVEIDQVKWHAGRYGSGLHSFEEEELDGSIKGWIIEKLWNRVTHGHEVLDAATRAADILEHRINPHRKDLCTDDELALVKAGLREAK